MTAPLLIFTDLDGSLLDHHHYGFAPAESMLSQLEQLGIPVIFNSSKTFAEQMVLRNDMGNRHPFITENGAALYLPKALCPEQPDGTAEIDGFWAKSFCPPRQHWLALLDALPDNMQNDFLRFDQASIADIMDWTGLSEAQAERAAQRHHSEPLRWLGSPERAATFKTRLEDQGAKVLQGGRFLHVSGTSDKGKAMDWLSAFYTQNGLSSPVAKTLALGDSHNDVDMLEAADYAVVIKSPTGAAPVVKNKQSGQQLFYTDACGPDGWVEGVAQILHIEHIQTT